MDLKQLLCVFLLAEYNARILHWKSIGENFLDAHAEAEKQYDKAADAIDNIAERALRMGINPPEYGEAFDIVNNMTDFHFNMADPTQDYDREDVIKGIHSNLVSIMHAITAAHAALPDNEIGIRSYLENLHDEYDLYARYLIGRRVMDD